MKQRKRFMSVLTVYTASMLFAAGFAGQTAANQSRSLAQENGVYAQGGETMAAVIESVSKDAVDETIATAKAAKAAAEEEAKRKAEEEARRAEEEAKRAAEEAARAQIQAEEQ